MREDLEEMKKEVGKIKNEEKSFTLELLGDFKKQNKRQFIINVLLIVLLAVSNGIWAYNYFNSGIEEITETAETTGDGNACVGNNCSNGNVNNG